VPDQLRQALASNVRQLRSRRSLSQEDFADHTGIHRTYIGGIERAERNVTLATVERIADAFGIDPVELLRAVPK
jgi:transcriptional regulator with XRE-family HTH domain